MTDKPEITTCRCCNSDSLDWKEWTCISIFQSRVSRSLVFYKTQCQECGVYHIWTGEMILFIDSSQPAVLDERLPDNVHQHYKIATNEFELPRTSGAFSGLMFSALDDLCQHLFDANWKKMFDAAEHLVKLQYPEDSDNPEHSQRNHNVVDARIRLINLIFREAHK